MTVPDNDVQRGTSGRYDAEAIDLRHRLAADAVVVIVIRGLKGNGFSVSAVAGMARKLMNGGLSALLEDVASAVRGRAPDGVSTHTEE